MEGFSYDFLFFALKFKAASYIAVLRVCYFSSILSKEKSKTYLHFTLGAFLYSSRYGWL